MGIPVAQMVSVASGIFILPFFLFSATSGQLADKYEKGKLIRIIKTVEIGIMALATYGFVANQFPFLLLVLFLMGLHSTFFGPLKYSILPQHLKDNELVGGNALIEAGTFLSILLGTIAGGTLVSIPKYGPSIVSGILLLIAMIGWGTSQFVPEAKPLEPELKIQWNPVTPTWQIFKFTTKNRTVFISILAISWFWFFGAATLSLFPVYCKDLLKTNEAVVTIFLACFSIGIGVGSVLCERLSRGGKEGGGIEIGLVPLGALGMTIFMLDLSFSGRPEAFHPALTNMVGAGELLHHPQGLHVIVDLILLSIFSGLFIVPLNALLQEKSDAAYRSRMIAGNNIVNSFFMVLSSGMTVLLLKFKLSIPQIFLVLAVLNAVASILIFVAMPDFVVRFKAWVQALFGR